ncbi:DUF3147 family protein [Sphingobium sufflavum]|uniref:DUF3147 family protein n=1 Tax=Sphingobium sufflavum TaxID=1129547 RepID=UPI001F2E9CBA|nr:DUF3147 family protein [Sphingobium sufflavum]MCE7796614.1 DUF3147 family protein [Sphingobium sufflavum]
MGALAAKALLSGMLIAAIAELARRLPMLGALLTALPLIAIFAMMLLWVENPDAENMARYSQATFWYVLPTLPMFLLIPALLRHGVGFWLSLLLGILLTLLLYWLMLFVGARWSLKL